MIQAKKRNTALTGLVLAALLSLSYIYALTSTLHFTITPLRILGISSALLVVYTAIFWNKVSLRVTLGIAAAFGLFVLVFWMKKGMITEYSYRVADYLYWLNDYILGNVSNNTRYEGYTVIALCLLISFPVFLMMVQRFSFPIVLLSGVGLFVAQWVMEFFVSYAAFYLFIFIILVCYLQHVYLKKHTGGSEDYLSPAQFTLWIIPICALVVLGAFLVPASPKPVEWKWMDEKVMTLSSYFSSEYSNSFSKFDYFALENTGFGRNGRLGGSVKLDDTVAMEVKGEKSVYLKALGKDTYTGSAWLDTDKNFTDVFSTDNKFIYDLAEVGVGLAFLVDDSVDGSQLFTTGDFEITYKGLKTKSLFVPWGTQNLTWTGDTKNTALVNENTSVVMDKAMGKDFSYKTEAVLFSFNDENFKYLMRKSRKGLYNDVQRYRGNPDTYRAGLRANAIILQGQRTIRYADFVRLLAQNAQNIYSKYTQIPDTVPQRVKDLAAEITASHTNNYDKVKAIEQYLSGNFPYTLTPKSTPRDRDFVDYFLFEGKQGYCTYYASAMAILVRSIGLPARYIEGYMMPSSPGPDNTYVVTNETAHAWVEVYFEGFGWIPFEPTGPFTGTFYANNTPSQIAGENTESTPDEDLDSTPDPGPVKNIEEIQDEPGTTTVEKSYTREIVLAAVGALALAFMALIVFNIIRRRRRIHKIMQMEPRESVLTFYKHFMELLKLQGYPMKDGETPIQYSQRIDTYLILQPFRFRDITKTFVAARYSRNPVGEVSKENFMDFYRQMIQNTYSELGQFKFYIYRYIIGLI